MIVLKYLPLILGLAVFAAYYFAPRHSRFGAGRGLRWLTAIVSTLLVVYLFQLFLGRHYEIKYVFENTSENMELMYRISAVWAGQSGTFLLWYWLTALLLIGLTRLEKFERTAYACLGLVLVMIGVFLVKSNPFEWLPADEIKNLRDQVAAGMLPPDFLSKTDVPLNGWGLNPILKNPWMAIHPPLVFIGYALCAAPFALAAAGVAAGDFAGWVRRARPWAAAAWALLSAGIFCGSYWAYEVLGWGGYWGWDPVENASLFPWLASGALAHGLLVQGRGRRFAAWNIFLACLAMLLVLFTTFLTRSGAMSEFSVHSFEKSTLFFPILFCLLVFLAGSLYLWWCAARALRQQENSAPGNPSLAKSLLLWTVAAFFILTGFVMLGTMFPFLSKIEFLSHVPGLSKVFTGTATTVEQGYYNKTAYMGMLLMGGLLIVCPFVFVKSLRGLGPALRYAAVALGAAAGAGLLAACGAHADSTMLLIAYYVMAALAGAVISANLINVVHFVILKKWNVAGYVVHLGVGLMLLGVLTSSAGTRTETCELALQQTREKKLAEYSFREIEPQMEQGKAVALLDIRRGKSVRRARLEFPLEQDRQGIKPAILRTGGSDLYLIPQNIFSESGGGAGMDPNTVTLSTETPQRVGAYELIVTGWNTEHMRDRGTVGVMVEIRDAAGGAATVELPFSAMAAEGPGSPPVTLEDGTALNVMRIDPDGGNVLVHVTGAAADTMQGQPPVGKQPSASTEQGFRATRTEPAIIGAYTVRLKGWKIDDMGMNKGAVMVLVTAERNGQSQDLTLPFDATASGMLPQFTKLDDGTQLAVVDIDVNPQEPDKEFALLKARDSNDAEIAPAQNAVEESGAPQSETVTVNDDEFTTIGRYQLKLETVSDEKLADEQLLLMTFQVLISGEPFEYTLPYDTTGDMPLPAVTFVHDDGGTWRITDYDAAAGSVTMLVTPPTQPQQAAGAEQSGEQVFIRFEAMTKPLIALLWWGMILVTAGALVAVFANRPASESDK